MHLNQEYNHNNHFEGVLWCLIEDLFLVQSRKGCWGYLITHCMILIMLLNQRIKKNDCWRMLFLNSILSSYHCLANFGKWIASALTRYWLTGMVNEMWNTDLECMIVLATSPSNPPAVRVWTAKTVRFSSRMVLKPDLLLLGGPNPAPYPSTLGFCRVWLEPSSTISSFGFRIVLYMVAFRYLTVNCTIFTMVRRCSL